MARLKEQLPWYRQFWPWFLIALPGSVVIAAFATLAIAITHDDEIVRDDYYKDGLAINQQLDREQLARTMNLSATLTWQPDSGEIRVILPLQINEQRLLLHWLHPLKRQLDRDIVLTRRDAESTLAQGALFGGQVDTSSGGRFYIQLENPATDSGHAWRVRGEISAKTGATLISTTTLIP
jgi:hypothetical protein